MAKDQNYRYDYKAISGSRSALFKDSMLKDSFVNNSSFVNKLDDRNADLQLGEHKKEINTKEAYDMGSLKLLAELLNSQAEWSEIPDILKWSVKAIYDTCQRMFLNQGIAKKELERSIADKASKAELSSCVHVKANICDVSVIISEIASQIESKVDEETFTNALSDKVTYEDLQNLDDRKLDLEDFQEFLSKLDLDSITNSVNDKANWVDVNELLAGKMDKETITNAMNKKASKTEVTEVKDELSARINDLESGFKSKLEKILEAQDQFINLVESGELVSKDKLTNESTVIQDIRRSLESKLDRREIETYNREQVTNLSKIKDDVHEIIQKLSSNIDYYKKS